VLNPGDNGELALQLSVPVSAAAGSRLLLEREGRIIALGVVLGISAR
jgi:translation elongation factor EF-Tu-like GTPase